MKILEDLRVSFSRADWRSPNTHVFFDVQLIAAAWFVWLWWLQTFSESPLPLAGLCVIGGLIVLRYFIGMFFVTGWRHRYFAHRSFKVPPYMEWAVPVVAFICSMDAQRGICRWAADHIWHHKWSDKPQDLHSCKQKGGIPWCHIFWVTAEDDPAGIKWNLIPHLNTPALRWIETRQWIGILVGGGIFSPIGALLLAHFGGFQSFWGNFVFSLCAYFFATTCLWHGTFFINSAMHLFGKQRYDNRDESRNSLLFAIITMGEGWHNNHHRHYPSLEMAKLLAGQPKRPSLEAYWQGETWFEKLFDWTGIIIWCLIKLKILSALGGS
jgi:stearoyl-CoA desaturase (delta-9 desaturase)